MYLAWRVFLPLILSANFFVFSYICFFKQGDFFTPNLIFFNFTDENLLLTEILDKEESQALSEASFNKIVDLFARWSHRAS